MFEEIQHRPVLRFGIFEADLRTGELRRQGIRVKLHGRPFELLAALLERPGHLVTREELRRRLWTDDTFVDFEHGLNNAVNRVRRALGDPAASPRFVETLPRRGYRFIAPVEEVSTAGNPEPTLAWSAKAIATVMALGVLVLASAWLTVFLKPAGVLLPSASQPHDSPAYQAYLKGRYHQNKQDAAAWQRARQFFDEAVGLDPAFAPAYSALAAILNELGIAGALPPDEAHPLAQATAEQALRLDPQLAEGHLALGTAKLRMNWDWLAAERAYQHAIALEPRQSRGHHRYALLLAATGRWNESLAEIGRARELDPLNVSIQVEVGRVLYLARRHDEAIAQLRSTLEFEPAHPLALKLLSDAYLRQGMRSEAAETFARWLEAVGVEERERTIAARLLLEGGPARLARRNLTNPAGKRLDAFGVPLKVAISHAVIGHRGQALDWLERAYSQKDPRLIFLNVDPDFDSLRAETRFQRLLRGVGL